MRYLTYILLGVGGLIALVALAVVFLGDDEPAAVAPQGDAKSGIIADAGPESATDIKAEDAIDQAAQTAATDEAAVAASADQNQPQLAIDLAQVKPDGQAVFAGQAVPGAMITVFEGDIPLGETVADDNGEWVVILEKTLAPGQHLVSVAMETTTGDTELADVTLAIEIAASRDEQPLVAVLPQTGDEMPKLLQSPDDKPAEPAAIATADAGDGSGKSEVADQVGMESDKIAAPAIAPRALVWRGNSQLAISGVAKGGVRVVASTDAGDFAEAMVMANGDWTVFGTIDPSLVRTEFKFSLHDDSGSRVASYVLPVTMRDLDVGLDGSEMVVINRGDALWRIAYRSYGEGVRYVDIVRRNAGVIADPDLIYPNQIFALPKQ